MLNRNNFDTVLGMVQKRHQAPQRIAETIASMKTAAEGVTPEDRKASLAAEVDESLRQTGKYMSETIAAAYNLAVETDGLVNAFGLDFFQDTPIVDEDFALLETFKRDFKFKTWAQAETGMGKPRHQFIPRQTFVGSLVQGFTTDEVEYPLQDFQKGNINEYDRVQMELMYTFTRDLNLLAKGFLDSAKLASGLRATINFDPNVVQTNLPDKNWFRFYTGGADDTGEGASYDGKITLKKLKKVLAYFARWGGDAQIDNIPLMIRSMVLSNANLEDIWEFVSLVSLTNTAQGDVGRVVPESVQEQIWNTGRLVDAFGNKFVVETSNILAAGRAYISSNKPVGWFVNKPGMANVFREENPRANLGKTSKMIVETFILPSPYTYRYLVIDW